MVNNFRTEENRNHRIFSKTSRIVHPPIYMSGETIVEVNCHKHLGIFLSRDLHWHQQIEYIKSKALTRINTMRQLKFRLHGDALETIYISFIRPILEYADVLFDNCTRHEKDELEKLQYEAARIVTGTTKLVSIQKLMDEVGWETLEIRRRKHKLVLFFKMTTHLTPEYLSSLVPPTVDAASRYSLRNASNFQVPRARTTRFDSLFPSIRC